MISPEIQSQLGAALPNALDRFEEIADRLGGRPLFVCLDYDGTLTPIVSDPMDAYLSTETRASIRRLASVWPVAIVSGRALNDVRELVGLDQIHYAGSHGYEIRSPSGEEFNLDDAWAYYPLIDSAERALRNALSSIPGASVERKKFALAAHYRNVPDGLADRVSEAVGGVSRDHPGLRRSSGKKIHEFRPEIDWDKGKAVRRIQKLIDSDSRGSIPVYIGDDTTDEDAFAEIQSDGIGVLVRDEDSSETAAAYALDSTDQVREFLDQLAEMGDE